MSAGLIELCTTSLPRPAMSDRAFPAWPVRDQWRSPEAPTSYKRTPRGPAAPAPKTATDRSQEQD